MSFQRLILEGWRQFKDVDIEFHPRLTVITGENGAGKSTILKVLSQHFGWSHQLLSTPQITKEGERKFFSGMLSFLKRNKRKTYDNEIGRLIYKNAAIASLLIPDHQSASYQIQINNQQAVAGLHIQSHRQVQNYQPIANIPLTPITADSAYNNFLSENISRYLGGHTTFSGLYRMKEAIISMATFGAGNAYVPKNFKLEQLFLDFKKVLAAVLPPTVGFLDISIRVPDVVIVTESGEFMIDASSGGVMSLIELAWQIFLYSNNTSEFVVTIDEPENHLHPSMQRSLLPNLMKAFPKAQFIVATHSPFIVSSVKDSNVYVLRYESSEAEFDLSLKKQITSLSLDLDSKAATANEILREVLGVPVTLPEWAEKELREIVNTHATMEINPENLKALRASLETAGLSEYYPETLSQIVRS